MADDATLTKIRFQDFQFCLLQRCRVIFGDTPNHDKLVKCVMEKRFPNQPYCWDETTKTEPDYPSWLGQFRPVEKTGIGALQKKLVDNSEKSTIPCDVLLWYYDNLAASCKTLCPTATCP